MLPHSHSTAALSYLTKIMGVLSRNPALVLAESEETETAPEEGEVVVGNLLAYHFLHPPFSIIHL